MVRCLICFMKRLPSIEQRFHGALFLTYANGKQTQVQRQAATQREPGMAKQSHAHEFGNNIEKVVRMTDRAEQEAAVYALIGHDIELHRPHVAELVDDIEEHDIGEEHDRNPDFRCLFKLYICSVGLV